MLIYIIAALLVLPIIYVLYFTDKVREQTTQPQRPAHRPSWVVCPRLSSPFSPRCCVAVCVAVCLVQLSSSFQLPAWRADGRV